MGTFRDNEISLRWLAFVTAGIVIFPTFARPLRCIALGPPLLTFSGVARYSRPVTHFGQRNFRYIVTRTFLMSGIVIFVGLCTFTLTSPTAIRKISCLSRYARVNISRDSLTLPPGLHGSSSGPKVVSVDRSKRYCRRNDRAGHSKSPFIPHRTINEWTRRADLDTANFWLRSLQPIFILSRNGAKEEIVGMKIADGRGKEGLKKEKRLPCVKSRRRLFIVREIAADKSTSSFLFLSSPVIPPRRDCPV